jgi:hypothetical protein
VHTPVETGELQRDLGYFPQKRTREFREGGEKDFVDSLADEVADGLSIMLLLLSTRYMWDILARALTSTIIVQAQDSMMETVAWCRADLVSCNLKRRLSAVEEVAVRSLYTKQQVP